MELKILTAESQKDYELIDSGDGEKLERYGDVIMRRPDPSAIWKKHVPESMWEKSLARFFRKGTKTSWKIDAKIPKEWPIIFDNLTFIIRPTSFKHVGLFPEQLTQWKYAEDAIKKAKRSVSVLNLFGYTGGATLSAARAGAEVTHVDGSKIAVQWAKENARASKMDDAPIRWIVDDCISYMKREIKRGKKYDAIIMDPPAFGHGPHDELWKIEEDFQKLLDLSLQLLSDSPLFVIINGYAAGYSPIAYEECLRQILKGKGGVYESGELAIQSKDKSHLLPSGIFARWSTQ